MMVAVVRGADDLGMATLWSGHEGDGSGLLSRRLR